MKRLLSIVTAVVLLGFSFVLGTRCRVPAGISVSFDVDASSPFSCQLFYAERKDEPFDERKSVSFGIDSGQTRAHTVLPVRRLAALRVDFGSNPGRLRLGPVFVSGMADSLLDWNRSVPSPDVDAFSVEDDGSLVVVSGKADPFAVFAGDDLDVPGRIRLNRVLAASVFLAAGLLWWLFAGPGGIAVQDVGKSVFSRSFFVLLALAVTARLALSAGIPVYFGASDWDDGWFVNAAASLRNGEWLGPYDDHTLVKGCFGPMVMAASSLLGVSFPLAQTLLHAAGCLFALFVLSRMFRNRSFLLAAFLLLLFNPLSYSLFSWQKTYRNGMALWQVPLVFGCLFMLWRASRGCLRGILRWGVVSGAAIWMFQNTREDGLWLWPFTLGVLAFSAFRARATGSFGSHRFSRVVRSFSCLVPLAVFLFGNALVRLANWNVYGVPILNDRNSGNYAKAMRDLYLVKPDPEDEARLSSPEHDGHYHNIYYSTLCKAYEASPTLAGARREIDAAIDAWAGFDQYAERDLRGDHMLFAIRHGAFADGRYSTLGESEAFWGAVHDELTAAFRSGVLVRRGLSVTAMAAPFRTRDAGPVFREWRAAVSHVVHFADCGAELVDPGGTGRPTVAGPLRPLFEFMAGARMPPPEDWYLHAPSVDAANRAVRAYRALVPPLFGLALAGYAALTLAIFAKRGRRVGFSVDGWLLATGVLGSFLAHALCIAYVSATTFAATKYWYLASSHQMVLLFIVLVFGCVAQYSRHCDACAARHSPAERPSFAERGGETPRRATAR